MNASTTYRVRINNTSFLLYTVIDYLVLQGLQIIFSLLPTHQSVVFFLEYILLIITLVMLIVFVVILLINKRTMTITKDTIEVGRYRFVASEGAVVKFIASKVGSTVVTLRKKPSMFPSLLVFLPPKEASMIHAQLQSFVEKSGTSS